MITSEEETRIRLDERHKVYDELGVLYGEGAKEFLRYMNDPHDITPEGAKILKEARELSKRITNFDRFTIED